MRGHVYGQEPGIVGNRNPNQDILYKKLFSIKGKKHEYLCAHSFLRLVKY